MAETNWGHGGKKGTRAWNLGARRSACDLLRLLLRGGWPGSVDISKSIIPSRTLRPPDQPAPSPGCLSSCLPGHWMPHHSGTFQWKRLRDRGPVSPGIPAPVLTLASRASMTLPHASVPLAQGVLRSQTRPNVADTLCSEANCADSRVSGTRFH